MQSTTFPLRNLLWMLIGSGLSKNNGLELDNVTKLMRGIVDSSWLEIICKIRNKHIGFVMLRAEADWKLC